MRIGKKSAYIKISALLLAMLSVILFSSCGGSESEIINGSGEATQDYTFENVMTVTVPGEWITEITEKGTVISVDTDEFTQGIVMTLMDADKDEITVKDAVGYMLDDETDISDVTEAEINGIKTSYFDLTGTNTDDDGTVKTVYGRYYLIQADESRIVVLGLLNCEEKDFAFADSILSSVTLIKAD